MAVSADLRAWISLLEREGELVRVGVEVDPELEITEITDRTVKAGGPALLFEKVKGSDHPLLINQFGTERRMCMAFDAPSLDAVAERVSNVLEMQPPQGLVDKVRGLKKLKSIADSQPKRVRSGPCQEVVSRHDDVDLDALPIQRCWPGDPAPFITLPAALPCLPRHGGHDAPRRDLPLDRRRQAAARGRLARQGDRADLPARGAHDRAGDRRLRPSGRGRLPQLRDRLDPQGVPRPREQ